MLEIKTTNGIFYVSHPPNGGWGWIVMVASFFMLGIVFGTSKSLGIYFLDLKNEFDVTNSATSWFSSLFLGAIGLAGLLTALLPTRMNARVRIMIGGLVASFGLLLSAFSSNIELLYLGCFLAGAGNGIAFLTANSQVSLYFSTLRPLATGIMLSGSPVGATVFPYLNNYLLARYGWKNSFWILSAINLNIVMLGALIRPIRHVSNKHSEEENDTNENIPHVVTQAQPANENASIENSDEKLSIQTINSATIRIKPSLHFTSNKVTISVQENRNPRRLRSIFQQAYLFVTIYWVALCLIFVNFIFSLCIFVPNVFLVPLTRGLGYSPDEGAMLLSFISIFDIICRPLSGALITRFRFIAENILLFLCVLNVLMSLTQLFAVFAVSFSVLVFYTLLHGCLFGFITTAGITAVPSLMGKKNIDKCFGIFYALGSVALLASGPFAGVFVDMFDDYSASYWYSFIFFGATGVSCSIMHLVVKKRGEVVLKKEISRTTKA